MITAGVDVGAKTIKIVILEDGKIRAKNLTMAGYNVREALAAAWTEIEATSGLRRAGIASVVSTGAGRKEVPEATDSLTEVSAIAKGAIALDKSIRTVIDIGAEEGRAIKIDENGKVVDFAVNEKCAAGTGAFIEAMARALEVKLEELGPLALQSTQAVAMTAQCAVFAESELVTLVHGKIPKPDMARAIHDAIADRIVSMVRRVGMEDNVMLIGGVAKNIGFYTSLKRELETDVTIPDDPEYVGAFGAALVAAGNRAQTPATD